MGNADIAGGRAAGHIYKHVLVDQKKQSGSQCGSEGSKELVQSERFDSKDG